MLAAPVGSATLDPTSTLVPALPLQSLVACWSSSGRRRVNALPSRQPNGHAQVNSSSTEPPGHADSATRCPTDGTHRTARRWEAGCVLLLSAGAARDR